MTTLTNLNHQSCYQLSNHRMRALLDQCMLNHRLAQKELYHIYHSYSITIALRYCADHEQATEITNQAFFKMFKGLASFTPRFTNLSASFMGWLKKIVVNVCIDYLRKNNNNQNLFTTAVTAQTFLRDKYESPDEAMQYKDIINLVQKLSPAYKTVFQLYAIEGLSHAEIARKLQVTQGTSKSNLFKAKENLKKLLLKNNISCYG